MINRELHEYLDMNGNARVYNPRACVVVGEMAHAVPVLCANFAVPGAF